MSDEMKVQTKGINKKFIFIAIAIIAIGLMAALVLLLPTSVKAKKVEEQLNLGAKYLSELDYEQAIVAYEAVIKIDPKCEEAYLALADVYIATGEFEKAEEILKKAEEEIGSDTQALKEKRQAVAEERKQAEGGTVPSPTEIPTPEPTVTPTPTLGTQVTEEKDGDGREFHSLSADAENLLSFDEITFLGHSIVNLDIDTVQRVFDEKNYSIMTNLEWDDPEETDYLWVRGDHDQYIDSWISAMQYFSDDYVRLWDVTQYTHSNETRTPVGTRDINMHDTFGEVFEKIGFNNAYEVEADIEYCFEQAFLNDNEMGEKDWSISGMLDYREWSQGLSVGPITVGWTEGKKEYNFSIILTDASFRVPNMDRNYSLELMFEQDEKTNGKFILTGFQMSVYREP